MRNIQSFVALFLFGLLSITLSSCATYSQQPSRYAQQEEPQAPPDYTQRLPHQISATERTVLVDPNVHAWGAYEDGSLVKAGLATAGSDYCRDLHRPCHTHPGTYRVNSLGSPDCKSTMFPIGKGGAPMPYCMFFDRNQALHGVPEGEVVEGNISHGCVRMHVTDAEWLRYNFVHVGTKVVVKSY